MVRLAALFSLDSFGGGFTVQAFVAFWLAQRFDASVGVIGVDVLRRRRVADRCRSCASGRLADRFGMLPTMVFTHLPSNLVLIAIAFSPTLCRRHRLLLAAHAAVADGRPGPSGLRDGPRRTVGTHGGGVGDQHRPLPHPSRRSDRWPGAAQSVALGFPFVIAGALKSVYDVVLWRWFRHVPLPDPEEVSA